MTQISYYLAAFTTLYLAAFLSQVFPAAIMLSNVAQLILPLATAASVAIVHAHKAYANRSFDDVISNFCTVHETTLQAIDEEQRQATENTAATKIQSLLRTRMPKELLHGLKKDKEDNARREKNVSTLQTWASGLKNKTNNAATAINNAYRAYKARNKLNSLKTALARIQNAVRTYLAKNKLESLKTAKAERTALARIQNAVRTYLAKNKLESLKTAKAERTALATRIQNAVRTYLAKNKLESLKTAKAERTALATRIQNAVRTYLAKNKLESLKTEKAATKIQSILRTIKPKQLLQGLKKDNRDTARRANNISTLQAWASGLNKNKAANAKEIAAASIEAGNNQPVSSQSFSNVAEEKTAVSAALSPNTLKARQFASAGSQNRDEGTKQADLLSEIAKAAQRQVANGAGKKNANKTTPKRGRKRRKGKKGSPRKRR